ncbi:MAG: DUF1800 domain-containing protein [Phycisphaerae bacterium]|nr:DUF1800 domain-containing protein [Saprospiraceae bacterium]
MALSKQLKLQHLLWRTGFGPATTETAHWESLPESAWWTKVKEASVKPPGMFDVADGAVKGLVMGVGMLGKMERNDLTKEEKKKLKKQSREDLKNLNLRWLEEMVETRAQLREKIALFWHGHFASRNINILYQQQLLDVVRTHALGNFGDLLRGVSKTAAMLAFLNNQQNKKQHPNENFAREVMELFTLGRGNYTENDVKEAARAFTGWSHRLDGTFVFRLRDHDSGSKTVLGKTGNFDGDDMLDILLEKRETARFIARKLYKFLVNETLVPEERINWLGDRFFDSGYKIMRLLEDIARSDWFYAPENMGVKIKSPVELWVGIRRTIPMELADPESQLVLQKVLGQVLFYPPNVAGWPGGRNWIDSSSLMLRLRIPQLLYRNQDLDVHGKTDDDQQMGEAAKGQMRRLSAVMDWQPAIDLFAKTPDNELIGKIAEFLWAVPTKNLPWEVLQKNTDRSNRSALVQTAMVQLMATPEYQLC